MSSTEYKIGERYPWNGGDCPVPKDTKVCTILRNMIKDEHLAQNFRWKHWDSPGDILEFSVVSYPDATVPASYNIGTVYDWDGGPIPVQGSAIVTAWLRNGDSMTEKASNLRWTHLGFAGDVVKFKINHVSYVDPNSFNILELTKDVEDHLIEASENASYTPRVMTLYHATTPAKAKKYRDCGSIHGPVRGFTTLQAAMAWALKVNRTVIYEIFCEDAHKLPDHHNRFGDAWWNDGNVTDFKCVFSADSDA